METELLDKERAQQMKDLEKARERAKKERQLVATPSLAGTAIATPGRGPGSATPRRTPRRFGL